MKIIPLTKGQFTMVDDEDYELLMQWKWHAIFVHGNFYARRTSQKNNISKSIKMHRQIMNITDSNILIDHADGNTLNNMKANLRICTHSQNCANRRIYSKSKYKGIKLNKNGKWSAQIGVNGKIIWLGTFNSDINAAIAYNDAAIKFHGEFARLNKV